MSFQFSPETLIIDLRTKVEASQLIIEQAQNDLVTLGQQPEPIIEQRPTRVRAPEGFLL